MSVRRLFSPHRLSTLMIRRTVCAAPAVCIARPDQNSSEKSICGNVRKSVVCRHIGTPSITRGSSLSVSSLSENTRHDNTNDSVTQRPPRCQQSSHIYQCQFSVLQRAKALHDKVYSVLSSTVPIPTSRGCDEYTAVVCGVVAEAGDTSQCHTIPSLQQPLSSLFTSVGVNHFIHKHTNSRNIFSYTSGCECKTRLDNHDYSYGNDEDESFGTSFTLPGILKGCAEQNAIGAFAASGSLPYDSISSLYVCGRRGFTNRDIAERAASELEYVCKPTTGASTASLSKFDVTETTHTPVLDSMVPCMTCWRLLRMIYCEKLSKLMRHHSNINNVDNINSGTNSRTHSDLSASHVPRAEPFLSTPTSTMQHLSCDKGRNEMCRIQCVGGSLTVYLSITFRDFLLIKRWQRWAATTQICSPTTSQTNTGTTFGTSSELSTVRDFQSPSSSFSPLVTPTHTKPPSGMWVPPSHLIRAFHHSNVTSIMTGSQHSDSIGCDASDIKEVNINGKDTFCDDCGHRDIAGHGLGSAITEKDVEPYIVLIVNSEE